MEFLEPKLLTMGPVLDVETGVQGEEPRGEDHGRGSRVGGGKTMAENRAWEVGGRPWPRIARHSSTPLNLGLPGRQAEFGTLNPKPLAPW